MPRIADEDELVERPRARARATEDELVEAPPRVRLRSRTAPTLRSEQVRTDKVRRRKMGSKSEDPFWIPEELRRELEAQDLSWEFKRNTTYGKEEDADYHIGLAENAWEPLQLNSFPGFRRMLPPGWTKNTYEKKGQVLMIRPMELTQEARAEELYEARSRVKGQMAQLKEAGPNEMERTLVSVKRSYERGIPVT